MLSFNNQRRRGGVGTAAFSRQGLGVFAAVALVFLIAAGWTAEDLLHSSTQKDGGIVRPPPAIPSSTDGTSPRLTNSAAAAVAPVGDKIETQRAASAAAPADVAHPPPPTTTVHEPASDRYPASDSTSRPTTTSVAAQSPGDDVTSHDVGTSPPTREPRDDEVAGPTPALSVETDQQRRSVGADDSDITPSPPPVLAPAEAVVGDDDAAAMPAIPTAARDGDDGRPPDPPTDTESANDRRSAEEPPATQKEDRGSDDGTSTIAAGDARAEAVTVPPTDAAAAQESADGIPVGGAAAVEYEVATRAPDAAGAPARGDDAATSNGAGASTSSSSEGGQGGSIPWEGDNKPRENGFFDVNEKMIPPVDVDPALQPPGTLPSDTGDIDGPGTSVWDRVRTWAGAAPGAAVGPSDVPVRDGGGVPRRMFTIWNERKLGFRALLLHRRWLGAERGLEHVIVTQDECSELAALRPGFRTVFDALPMVVMRADMCRVLVLYLFGGYWRDLDVDFRRPLGEWVNTWLGMTVGYEDDEHVCTWFFAARPGDVCLGNVLQHMENLIRNVTTINFKTNVEAVSDMTGPGAMTDGLQGCPYGVQFDYESMRTKLVHHEYAGTEWANMKDYSSWLEDRKEKGGFKEVWPEFVPKDMATTRQDEYLVPERDDLPPVAIREVIGSREMDGQPLLYGALNAFDGSMDTVFYTGTVGEKVKDEWFSIDFAEPMTIGTLSSTEVPGPDHLAGLRLVNKHSDPDLDAFFEDAIHVELYDESGTMFWNARKPARQVPLFQYYFAGHKRHVKKIVIRKAAKGRILLGEVQLCSDAQCTLARKVTIANPKAEELEPESLRAVTTITHRCPGGRTLSTAEGLQYTDCDPRPRSASSSSASTSSSSDQQCTAYLIAMDETQVSGDFAEAMASRKCTLQPLGEGPWNGVDDTPNVEPAIEEDFCQGNCYTSERLAEVVPAAVSGTVDLMRVDLTPRDWTTPLEQSPLWLATAIKPQQLFVPVALGPEQIDSTVFKENIRLLLQTFDVHGFFVDTRQRASTLLWSLTRRAVSDGKE